MSVVDGVSVKKITTGKYPGEIVTAGAKLRKGIRGLAAGQLPAESISELPVAE